MPCLHLGSVQKTIYIPVEFCMMEKQPLPRSVTPRQVSYNRDRLYLPIQIRMLQIRLPRLVLLVRSCYWPQTWLPSWSRDYLIDCWCRGKKLPDDAVANMIRGTAVRPDERRAKILEGLQRNNAIYQNCPYAQEFGISFEAQMVRINGRQGQGKEMFYSIC